ncbi:MAG: DUF1735 domain-containing protein [Cyclobacteriaceae bacterium]|nr:DUF1735 domain-containing protein [Cyclobacteriaceae bacterium]
MKLNRLTQRVVALLLIGTAGIVQSCITDSEDISGVGANRIRFSAGEFSIVTFTPDAIETKGLVTIYRDAISEGDNSKSVTVTLSLDEAALEAYNEENETDFVLLDPASYTLSVSPGTITFAPGESAKTIRITLNTGLIDLSLKHVLPFAISSASSGFEVNERLSLAIVQTLPINKFDGVYEVTGDPWVDAANAAITDYYPFEWYAETTGENSIVFFDTFFGTYFHPISSGGSRSAYGCFGVEATFNPTTGKIVDLKSPWSPCANTRDLTWDSSVGINQWNESDGSIDMTYNFIQPSVVTTPPHIRVSFNEHLEYTGPR